MSKPPNDGRRVKKAAFGGEFYAPIPIRAGHTAVFHNEFHGDHDEDWVCVYDESAKEVARYNTRYLSMIEWEEEAK